MIKTINKFRQTKKERKNSYWLPREVPRKIYKFLMSLGGDRFFFVFVIIIPGGIIFMRYLKGISFPLLPTGTMNEILKVIAGSILIGVLVFLGTVIIETRNKLEKNKLKKIWKGILTVITFAFSVAILSLSFIALSEFFRQQNLEVPILIIIFALVYYTFYLIIDILEHSFL